MYLMQKKAMHVHVDIGTREHASSSSIHQPQLGYTEEGYSQNHLHIRVLLSCRAPMIASDSEAPEHLRLAFMVSSWPGCSGSENSSSASRLKPPHVEISSSGVLPSNAAHREVSLITHSRMRRVEFLKL
jgi:hypothetical protein